MVPIMAEPTKEEFLARVAELEKQVAAKKPGTIGFKVSEKGGVSVYGLGRFPVTLYYEHGPGSWMQGRTCVLSWQQTKAA